MYHLPDDLVNQLQQQYPDVHIKTLIPTLFQAILEKTLSDGSCLIRGFGRFVAYKTYSNKIGQDVIRFKFKPSQALDRKLKNDEYLLEKMPVQAKRAFNESHAEKCQTGQEQKGYNVEAQKAAGQLGNERTKDKLILDEVIRAIKEDNE